ncbi:MAG TPA: ammonia-forming cytochrome c nitrite reductase subunit c552 [Vicinamibacterales bacterium]|nr:ammonia-forming cytochrome c nitrite reductase subunit c552 [Vicinamibacterales bacterium]
MGRIGGVLTLAVAASTIAWASAQQSPSADGYVGAAACASCHASIHDTWKSGRHSKMLQPATAASVKGDFAQTTVTLRGQRYALRARNGEYFIAESELTGKEQEHRIDFTLGSRRIQHYLTTVDRGRIVVMAPSWDVQRQEWFHNVEIIRPDEDDRLVVQQWNRSCVGCHVSRQDQRYDAATHTYATQWMDFGTSCERCHGPGRAHIAAHAARANAPAPDRSIVRPTRLTAEASTGVCAQCHSLRTAINPGYAAGDDYADFFVPVLEYAPYARPHASKDPPYWADGRPRRFSNDAIGLWQSACYLRGGATCTNCHADPHLPDIDRNPQLAPNASNALCAKCHQDVAASVTTHSRHRAASGGSSCVECHMPKTVVSIKSTMRDHTIGVPAPENTVAFGIPNACTECHKDKPASWAVDVLRVWWPDGRRTRLVARAEAFSAARAGRASAIEPLLAIAEGTAFDPLTRANAVGYLGNYADARALDALVRAAQSPHPAIRATAIAGLRANGHANPAARAAVLRGLGDPQRSVRIASLLTLIAQGDQSGSDLGPGDRARFRSAGQEFAQWSAVGRDDADLQRLQGIVNLLDGDFTRAADALAIGFDLEPEMPSLRFFLGLARLGQRRVDEARALFKQIPRSDPYYDKAQEQLKRLP